ncbi:hypothetical protein OCU04_011712 [Sclerotinia nivalis]|uniref:non-specific serine/threonine protein kinase n=1 Tax=Sclerotinia nivalis TaxID=352851 RepID=A0A9X0ACA1_9HELO|nr:hypothetical protein OCU04_011712 [Sclerotinia nivalis]
MPASPHPYQPSALDDIEELENFSPGGFHPIDIGDKIGGRYKVIHKLGYGGFSTVYVYTARLQRVGGFAEINVCEFEGYYKISWEDGIVRASRFELDEMIAEIGAEDEEGDDPERNCAVMLEPNGMKVSEEEASLRKDLFGRILKWKPEERISIKEIMDHRWLL